MGGSPKWFSFCSIRLMLTGQKRRRERGLEETSTEREREKGKKGRRDKDP